MATTNTALRQNPYITYRDPETGRWVVEKLVQESEKTTASTPEKIEANHSS